MRAASGGACTYMRAALYAGICAQARVYGMYIMTFDLYGMYVMTFDLSSQTLMSS